MRYRAHSKFAGTDVCLETLLVPATKIRKTPELGTILYDEFSSYRKVRSYLPIECEFPEIYARHIIDPILTNEFIVHKNDLVYIDSSIHSEASAGVNADSILETFPISLNNSDGQVDLRYANESAMVFHNEGGGTWGHFVVQNLPRALLYLAKFPNGKIVLPRDHSLPGVTNFNRSLLQLGVPQDRLLPVERTGSYQFRELVLIDFMYDFPKQIPHPLALELLAAPMETVGTLPNCQKMFVARAPSFDRSIENGPEVEEVMTKHGIQSIVLGKQSFETQVKAWRSSDLIVATLGSDLTNIVFGKVGTRILSLSPDWFGDTFFYNLAVMKGMQWNELRCGALVEAANVQHKSSFRVQSAVVDAMLNTLAR
jgi:hypothetical protein